MHETRTISRVIQSKPTIEGAGVRLKRAFGFREAPLFDPFLLLDDFRSENPEDYVRGFPWHPHRGIETITYVLRGEVEHGDSMGNRGVIRPGDVQWMTAGSGVIHQEMPRGDHKGSMGGFQLWANLPASHKMMRPRYRDVLSRHIPEITAADGTTVRIICGSIQNAQGPVRDIITEPEYVDISVPPGSEYAHPTRPGHTVLAYVIEGKGRFCTDKKSFSHEAEERDGSDIQRDPRAENETLIIFNDGDHVLVSTEESRVRFLLISGKPIGEPVAWYGPIVMNTEEELRSAFDEYRSGTFIKHRQQYNGKNPVK